MGADKDIARAKAALKLAIARVGVVSLANMCQITPSAVSQWEVCPVGRAWTVSEASGIPKEDLRPDIFE